MGKRIDISKDEISNLMDCISITKKIINIIKKIDKIKWYIKNVKTNGGLNEGDTLDTLHKKLLDKLKYY